MIYFNTVHLICRFSIGMADDCLNALSLPEDLRCTEENAFWRELLTRVLDDTRDQCRTQEQREALEEIFPAGASLEDMLHAFVKERKNGHNLAFLWHGYTAKRHK